LDPNGPTRGGTIRDPSEGRVAGYAGSVAGDGWSNRSALVGEGPRHLGSGLVAGFFAPHHSYPDVNGTTSVRHHPIEYVLCSAVYWVVVIVLNVPVVVVVTHGLAVFGTAALPARQYPPGGAAGAVAAAGVGHGGHAPHPPRGRLRAG